MKANQNIVLVTERLALVPYAREHVPTYHSWMLDEELRTLTASEPLSLEEEYEMQQKWRDDEDKLTFIILSRESCDMNSNSSASCSPGTTKASTYAAAYSPQDPALENLCMVGDINLFLKGRPPSAHNVDNSEGTLHPGSDDEDEFEAEIEVMIAEPSYRRKGLAREALQIFLEYATGFQGTFSGDAVGAGLSSKIAVAKPLPVSANYLVVRISQHNTPSIRLFEALNFRVVKVVTVFEEVEMRYGSARPIWTAAS